jgi:ADP-heptose:LPS heptosyltransferase
MPKRYGVLQPRSGFARNPDVDYVRRVVEAAVDATAIPVYAIGMRSPNDPIVDDSQMREDVPHLLSMIAHATFVLTPRSASAHVAAAYGVPSVVWVPRDGENWHLDYPNWNTRRLEDFGEDPAPAIREFLSTIVKASNERNE